MCVFIVLVCVSFCIAEIKHRLGEEVGEGEVQHKVQVPLQELQV